MHIDDSKQYYYRRKICFLSESGFLRSECKPFTTVYDSKMSTVVLKTVMNTNHDLRSEPMLKPFRRGHHE